jgi:phage baseplate assembly protein W
MAISLPFTINSYGKVQTTIDQKKIWADRVYSVIGTLSSERVMRPTFGSDAAKELLSSEEVMITNVENSVRLAFLKFLPTLNLLDISASYDRSSNIINIEIVYSLPNQEIVNEKIGFAQITGNNPIYEETL